jgi:hypothetical protein
MKLQQIWCYIKTAGNHIDLKSNKDGDQYCINCNEYLYTNYNFKESLRSMRSAWKMWWENKE